MGREFRAPILLHRWRGRTLVLILGLLAAVFNAHAQVSDDLVIETHQGFVNWTRGYIQVKAVKVPKLNAEMAETAKAAEADAREKLVSMAYDIPIDTFRHVRDLDTAELDLLSNIRQRVSGIPIYKQQYLSDGTAQIVLRLNLTGAFAELVLPSEIKHIDLVRTVQGAKADTNTGGGKLFSGLVVDAKGIGLQPAMTPGIVDENGRQVYGELYASREFAVQQGMCRYFRDLEAARRAPRVGDRPLMVRGLRTAGPGKTHVVINNADADKIRSASKHLTLLRKCQVVLVVD